MNAVLSSADFFIFIFFQKFNGRHKESWECHNKIIQPILGTKRQSKLQSLPPNNNTKYRQKLISPRLLIYQSLLTQINFYGKMFQAYNQCVQIRSDGTDLGQNCLQRLTTLADKVLIISIYTSISFFKKASRV